MCPTWPCLGTFLTLSKMLKKMLLLLWFSLCSQEVVSSVVLHEYHSPQLLAPLSSYSSLAVTRWRIPVETRLATWTIQTSSEYEVPANITM